MAPSRGNRGPGPEVAPTRRPCPTQYGQGLSLRPGHEPDVPGTGLSADQPAGARREKPAGGGHGLRANGAEPPETSPVPDSVADELPVPGRGVRTNERLGPGREHLEKGLPAGGSDGAGLPHAPLAVMDRR